jgi:restriction system protein
MLTTQIPDDWRDLQDRVARILAGCAFSVEAEKVIQTVRGSVEIDVFAREVIDGRTYTVLCECKHWAARVPQNVIHGFRTVVADSGANLGYIISTAGFQTGALNAAELTNIRLVTWPEFQSEFEASWIKNYMIPTIEQRLDKLNRYTEPIPPYRLLDQLTENAQRAFMELRNNQQDFWPLLFTMFSPHLRLGTPELPFQTGLPGLRVGLPDALLDAVGYSDFLDAVLA